MATIRICFAGSALAAVLSMLAGDFGAAVGFAAATAACYGWMNEVRA